MIWSRRSSTSSRGSARVTRERTANLLEIDGDLGSISMSPSAAVPIPRAKRSKCAHVPALGIKPPPRAAALAGRARVSPRQPCPALSIDACQLNHFENDVLAGCWQNPGILRLQRAARSMLSGCAQRMLTPNEPSRRDSSRVALAGGDDAPRAAYEFAQHIGTSLALLGVMVIFLGALLRAEARELDTWRTRSLRATTMLVASSSAATSANAISSADASLEALDIQSCATRAFDRALFIAGVGAALSALALVLRRGSWWGTAVALALACLVLSTHQFRVARTQLSEAQPAARR